MQKKKGVEKKIKKKQKKHKKVQKKRGSIFKVVPLLVFTYLYFKQKKFVPCWLFTFSIVQLLDNSFLDSGVF